MQVSPNHYRTRVRAMCLTTPPTGDQESLGGSTREKEPSLSICLRLTAAEIETLSYREPPHTIITQVELVCCAIIYVAVVRAQFLNSARTNDAQA